MTRPPRKPTVAEAIARSCFKARGEPQRVSLSEEALAVLISAAIAQAPRLSLVRIDGHRAGCNGTRQREGGSDGPCLCDLRGGK